MDVQNRLYKMIEAKKVLRNEYIKDIQCLRHYRQAKTIEGSVSIFDTVTGHKVDYFCL